MNLLSIRSIESDDLETMLHLFVMLQCLDFLTTMFGFRIGLVEVSPIIKHFYIGPLLPCWE